MSHQDQDTSVVELDPILEAEYKHGPIFRRELFDFAYSAWQHLHTTGPQDSVKLRNIYGEECYASIFGAGCVQDLDGRKAVAKLSWSYNSLQSLGHSYNNKKDSEPDFESKPYLLPYLLPYTIEVCYVDMEERDCFQKDDIETKAQAWTKEWEESKMHRQLTSFLTEHVRTTLQRVDQIICFGFGCFNPRYLDGCKRSYMQHLAATTVCSIISQNQDGPAPPVYTQDPEYCAAGITCITSAPFNFLVLQDPEGFKALDGNTFVLSFAPNVPVRQIVMGLTYEYGGPVGMICDDIESEGLDCEGKGMIMEDKGSHCPYGTCDPSPALWKYKQESVWTECSDQEGKGWCGKIGVYLRKAKDERDNE